MLEIEFPSKILKTMHRMDSASPTYLLWTEREKQRNPAFLPWASVIVFSLHKQAEITFRGERFSQELEKNRYQNEYLFIRRHEIDFPGGEPLQEITILVKRQNSLSPSELKVSIDGREVFSISEEELGWEGVCQ